MAGAPEDGNPGGGLSDEARQRAEARALASLLRGSGPQYPFPVEEIEEHPAGFETPTVVHDVAEPARPARPELETDRASRRHPPAQRRRRAGRLVGVALVLLFLLVAAMAGLGAWELSRSRARADRLADELRRARVELGAVRDDLRDLRSDLRSLAEERPADLPALLDRVEPSVVGVEIRGKVTASGLVVEGSPLPRGYRTALLTRAWVARAANRGPVLVIHDRRSFLARPGEIDQDNGLALLFIKPRLSALPWAAEEPMVGEFVAGVGLPARRIGATTGVITVIGPHLLRTDAWLTPGGAGGPVVNSDGEAVGIARASRGGLLAAIPIDDACRRLVRC